MLKELEIANMNMLNMIGEEKSYYIKVELAKNIDKKSYK